MIFSHGQQIPWKAKSNNEHAVLTCCIVMNMGTVVHIESAENSSLEMHYLFLNCKCQPHGGSRVPKSQVIIALEYIVRAPCISVQKFMVIQLIVFEICWSGLKWCSNLRGNRQTGYLQNQGASIAK